MPQDPDLEKRIYDTTHHLMGIYEESGVEAGEAVIEICRSIAEQVEEMSDFFDSIFNFEEGDDD